DVFVELLVLLIGDLGLAARPERTGLIDGFLLVAHDLFALLTVPLFLLHEDGQRDVVGIAAQDLAQPPARQELVFAFTQGQDDVGAAAFFLDVAHGELAVAGGLPAY